MLSLPLPTLLQRATFPISNSFSALYSRSLIDTVFCFFPALWASLFQVRSINCLVSHCLFFILFCFLSLDDKLGLLIFVIACRSIHDLRHQFCVQPNTLPVILQIPRHTLSYLQEYRIRLIWRIPWKQFFLCKKLAHLKWKTSQILQLILPLMNLLLQRIALVVLAHFGDGGQ